MKITRNNVHFSLFLIFLLSEEDCVEKIEKGIKISPLKIQAIARITSQQRLQKFLNLIIQVTIKAWNYQRADKSELPISVKLRRRIF